MSEISLESVACELLLFLDSLSKYGCKCVVSVKDLKDAISHADEKVRERLLQLLSKGELLTMLAELQKSKGLHASVLSDAVFENYREKCVVAVPSGMGDVSEFIIRHCSLEGWEDCLSRVVIGYSADSARRNHCAFPYVTYVHHSMVGECYGSFQLEKSVGLPKLLREVFKSVEDLLIKEVVVCKVFPVASFLMDVKTSDAEFLITYVAKLRSKDALREVADVRHARVLVASKFISCIRNIKEVLKLLGRLVREKKTEDEEMLPFYFLATVEGDLLRKINLGGDVFLFKVPGVKKPDAEALQGLLSILLPTCSVYVSFEGYCIIPLPPSSGIMRKIAKYLTIFEYEDLKELRCFSFLMNAWMRERYGVGNPKAYTLSQVLFGVKK